MTHPIDTAYVDIVPVDKSLEKLQRDIDRAMKKIDKQVEKDLKKIDKDFETTINNIDKQFTEMEEAAEKSFREIEKAVDESFDDIDKRVNESGKRNKKHFTDLSDEAETSARRIGDKFGDVIKSTFGGLMDAGRGLIEVFSSFTSSGLILTLLKLAALAALLPTLLAVAAALSQLIGLIGLLPAGIGILLGALIPLVVAFQNFGEAVSAIAEGDVEKIEEALGKLSISARLAAMEIGKFLPFLKEFQKSIQEAFFAPLTGAFTQLMGLLNGVRRGVLAVATAWGQLIRSLVNVVTTPEAIQGINNLLLTTAQIITGLTGPLSRFLTALGRVTQRGLAFVDSLLSSFGLMLDRFSEFINTSLEDGSFDEFVVNALIVLGELVELVKAAGSLIGTLFGGTEDAGRGFIIQLTEAIKKLDEFFKSAEGQRALRDMSDAVLKIGAALIVLAEIFGKLIRASQDVEDFFKGLGAGIEKFVTGAIEWFKKLPQAISDFVLGIPKMIGDALKQAFDNALFGVGVAIGLIMFAIKELPKQIMQVLSNLPMELAQLFISIGDIVIKGVTFFIDNARRLLVEGFMSIIDFVRSVPQRLLDLIPGFDGSGQSLIRAFMNGLRRVGAFVTDVAGDIVGAIKGFLNKAIDKINSGIAAVDNVLPGNLPRIPRLAEGALVRHRPGGIMANIGEGNEDEFVAPLSKLEDMLQSNGGQSINFGAGAININFSGVVPTQREAQQTGQAVARGIIDMLTQRNMRVQVRAV